MLAFSVLTRFTAKDEQSKAIKTIGKAAAGAAIAIAAVSVASIKMAADFDTGLRKTSTIMDQNVMSFDAMRKGILQISNDTGRSVNLLTEAQYQAISATNDTASSLDFVRISTMAAIGGFTEEATAIKAVSGVLSAYGLEMDKSMKISDQMIATQNFGRTTFGELAQSMGMVIPTAAALKVKTEDLFAVWGTMTKTMPTAQAATSVNAALASMLKPSSEAIKKAKELEIEFSAKAVQKNGLIGMMEIIKKATKGNVADLGKLFGSTEALKTVMTATSDSGLLKMKEGLDSITNSTNSTKAAFDKMNGPQQKFNIAWNKLKNIGIELGTIVLPIVSKLAEMAVKVMTKFDGLSDGMKNAIIIGGGVLMLIGAISLAIPPIVTAFTTLSVAVGWLKLNFMALNLTFLASPLFWIPAAIIAVGAAFYMLQDRVGGVVPAIKLIGQTLLQYALAPINAVVFALQGLIDLLAMSASALGMDSISESLYNASSAIGDMQDKANNYVTGTTSLIPGSRMIEGIMQGDAEDTKKENSLDLNNLFSGSKSSLDLNINNNTGFEATTSGASSPGVAITLKNGSGGSW